MLKTPFSAKSHHFLLFLTCVVLFATLFSNTLLAQSNNASLTQAISAENKGKFDSALKLYKDAYIIAESSENHLSQIDILFGLLRVNQKLNRGADAFLIIERLERISAIVNDAQALIRNYRALAIAYQAVKRNEIARDYYAVAVEVAREEGSKKELASLLNEQAYADTLVHDLKSAIRTYSESKKLYQSLRMTNEFIDVSLNHLQALTLFGNKKLAVSLLRDLSIHFSAKTLGKRSLNSVLRFGFLIRSAHIKFNLPGHYRKQAFDYYSYVKRKTENVRNKISQYVYSLGYIGQMYADEGKYAEAIHFSRLALSNSESSKDLMQQFKWQLQLARSFSASKNISAAIEGYENLLFLF